MPEEKPTISKKHGESAVNWGIATTIIVAFAIFTGSQIVGGVLASFLVPVGKAFASLLQYKSSSQVLSQFLTIVALEAAMVLLLVWFLRYKQASLRLIGMIKPKIRDVGLGLLGFAAYMPAFILVTLVLSALIPGLNTDQQQQIGYSDAGAPPELLLVFISLVVLPPLVEELLFRGFIFTGLRAKLPFIYASLITSLLFAIPHLQISSGAPLLWIAAIDTFILSMVLVYLREKTGGLWASIVLHTLKNSVAFVFIFIVKTG